MVWCVVCCVGMILFVIVCYVFELMVVQVGQFLGWLVFDNVGIFIFVWVIVIECENFGDSVIYVVIGGCFMVMIFIFLYFEFVFVFVVVCCVDCYFCICMFCIVVGDECSVCCFFVCDYVFFFVVCLLVVEVFCV